MIERKFVNQNIKEFEIKEYIRHNLSRVGLSDVKLQRTPLGEKIIISTSRPGLVVGRSGTNITKLTHDLKQVFKLENPQIEIEEVSNVGLDANIIAEMIANSLEKFGIARFKGIGHKAMSDVMNAGAFGVEILIGGKVPSTRAKTWRFYQGYLKKCGDIAVTQIKVAYAAAQLKTGVIGIKVSIMTPDTILPDRMKIIHEEEEAESEVHVEEVKNAAVKKELDEKIKELEPKTKGTDDKKHESKAAKRHPKKKSETKAREQASASEKLADSETQKSKISENKSFLDQKDKTFLVSESKTESFGNGRFLTKKQPEAAQTEEKNSDVVVEAEAEAADDTKVADEGQ
jgi:small subunit ribosomal protein S3